MKDRKKYVGRIELTKYKDMAYCNRVGRVWLRVLSCAEVWGLWEKELRAFSRSLGTNVSAERVKVMCIWNFGYLEKFDGGGVRTAFEIRNPRGSDEDLAAREGRRETRHSVSKIAIGGVTGGYNAMSREVQMFDEFLERVVRPLVEAQLNINTTK
jgi:hypothetical protein